MSFKMKLVRVDNRLLHATVAINWSSFLNANFIAIVDPEDENDPFIEQILQLSLPTKIKLSIFSEEGLLNFLEEAKNDESKNYRIIIIFKNLFVLANTLQLGLDINKVQIPYPASRLMLKNMCCYFSEEEIEVIRKLHHEGVDFFYQTTPMDKKEYFNFKK